MQLSKIGPNKPEVKVLLVNLHMCRKVLVTLDTAGSLVINSLHHREVVAISNVACLIPNQNSFFFQEVKTNLKQFL